MSNLSKLVDHFIHTDPERGRQLRTEISRLMERKTFGLVWEDHNPESVVHSTRRVQVGDMVSILPARGKMPDYGVKYRVVSVSGGCSQRMVELVSEWTDEPSGKFSEDDVVVCNNTNMPIYPGLKETGQVLRGGDNTPCHSVITAENYDALKMLQFTHFGAMDVIYIDPPYNTGARDWKYNNDYVSATDIFRSSKWLSMMESRLSLAKNLLKTECSALVVAIDEKEYFNLGILLRQMFPEAKIQMVSSVISRAGSPRSGQFSRTDEYIYIVQIGSSSVSPLALDGDWKTSKNARKQPGIDWMTLRRTGSNRKREDSPGCFYPIFVKNTEQGPIVVSIGDVFTGDDLDSIAVPEGQYAVWPLSPDGEQRRWNVSPGICRKIHSEGFIKLGKFNGSRTPIYYAAQGERTKVLAGDVEIIGKRVDGSLIEGESSARKFVPGTQWNIPSHDAMANGTRLLSALLPDRKFPYPKSLYAVEDVLRFLVADKPDAKILDFFGGSGTTLHAVMRLNTEDNGNRQCILVSNNEVSDDEAKKLVAEGLRPGDANWEKYGICDYVTKPRIRAAVTGETSTGVPIKGRYKYNHQFPMSEGMKENVRFFTLSYESRGNMELGRTSHRDRLWWLYAGGVGDVLDASSQGYAVGDHYGVINDMSSMNDFIADVHVYQPPVLLVNTFTQSIFTGIVEMFPEATVVNALGEYLRVCDR